MRRKHCVCLLVGMLHTACAEPTLLGDDGADTAETATSGDVDSAPLHAVRACGPAGGGALVLWADAGSAAGCDATMPDEPGLLLFLEQSGDDLVVDDGVGSGRYVGEDGVLEDVVSARLTVTELDETSLSGTLRFDALDGGSLQTIVRSVVDVPLCGESPMCL